MCQEHADYDAIGCQQVSAFKSIESQKCGGQQYQKQDRKLIYQFFHRITKILKRCVKVDEPADNHGNKINQNRIIIIIKINELDICEDNQHIQHTSQTQCAFFLFFDNTKWNKKVIHDADQDDADNDKCQKNKVAVILPESPGSCGYTEIIKVNQKENTSEKQGGGGRKHQFIVALGITVEEIRHGKDTVGLTIVHCLVFRCNQQYSVNQNHNSQRHQ